MKIEDIEMHSEKIDRSFRTIGTIKVRVQAATLFSKTPTLSTYGSPVGREQITRAVTGRPPLARLRYGTFTSNEVPGNRLLTGGS